MRAVVLTCLCAFPRLRFSASARLFLFFIQSAGSPDDVVGSCFLWVGGCCFVYPWPRLSDCGNPALDASGYADGIWCLRHERTPLEASQRPGVGQNNILNVLASFDSGVSCWYPHEQASPSWWFSSIPCCRWVLFWNIKLIGPFQTTTRALAVLTNILRPSELSRWDTPRRPYFV
jgi:hypothetical protein